MTPHRWPSRSTIRRAELVQAEVGAQPIVLIATSDDLPVFAYDRRIDGRTLTFQMLDGDPLHLLDLETGTQWDIREGLGISGPLADNRMERVAEDDPGVVEGRW